MASLGTHIPKEITDYKEKILGGLTIRQLAAGSVAILAGGLTFAVCYMVFGLSARQSSYLIMAAAVFPAAVGFIRPNSMDFEKYLLIRYRHWMHSGPIAYKTITRGESYVTVVSRKAKRTSDVKECVTSYFAYDRHRERKILRATRKHIRLVQREIKRSQREFRKHIQAQEICSSTPQH